MCVSSAKGQGDKVISWKQCLNQQAAWYSSSEAIRIADNLLLYQRNSGGWPKNTEMAAVLTDADKVELTDQKQRTDSTIDNGATYQQLRYLAEVYAATSEGRFRDAFLAGVDYLLGAQYENGGWPQFYPNARGYSLHITFNDGAMINAMRLLRDVSQGEEDFAFVDGARRTRAKLAVDKGIDCILKCQIVHEGKRLAWCAQHDEKTLAPAAARSYELASLSGSEAVGVVEFLMTLENPSPKIIAAVEDAVRWFDSAKITGIAQILKPAPGTEKGYDKTIVADPAAPPIWARFYQIGTSKPIFCSRDGIPRDNLADISYERRNGYSWYTDAPADLLNKAYPAWAAKWTPGRNVLK
jgi:PelA/Pel-15E family pectate lyase